MRFIWGYIYVGMGLLSSALSGYGAYASFREGQSIEGVGTVVAIVITLFSVYGILRRRRWGLILTCILLGLAMVVWVWQFWATAREVPYIPGFVPVALLMPVAGFFYALFFFVYFLRRRKLFS